MIRVSIDREELRVEEIASAANLRAYAAELIGTMLFVLIGAGAVISAVIMGDGSPGAGGLVAIALAHGLGYAVLIYATANYSGGHLNPAVTLAMIVTRNIKAGPGVAYMVMQFLGGMMAIAVLYVILNDQVGEFVQFGASGVNTNVVGGDGSALLLEILLTAALVSVVFATAVSKRGFGATAPLVIGLAVVIIQLVSLPLIGASANPARVFAPALISNAFDSFWLYVLGPAIGAVAAGVLYHHFFRAGSEDDDEEAAVEEDDDEEADAEEIEEVAES